MALSDRAKTEKMAILDKIELTDAKTKKVNEIIGNIENKVLSEKDSKSKRSVLVLIDIKNEEVKRATSNLEGTQILNINNINIVDLLKYRNLIVTTGTVKKLEERYGKK